MTHPIRKSGIFGWKSLLAEMAVIYIVAAIFGISWNHTLLINAWKGKPTTAPKAPAAKSGEKPIPLPLGLEQVKELYDRKEATIIDARNRGDFSGGHIQGALSFPIGEAEANLARLREKVPATAMIVVYCNGYSCHDSMDLADRLVGAGWSQVFVFEGGYPEWRDAGYPVAKGE